MAGLGNASGVGAFFGENCPDNDLDVPADRSGTLLNGYLVAIFGQKRVLVCSLILLACLIFITFFAPSIQVLIVGQVLCGLPWGVFATTAPAYASEVLPMALRVYFTSWTNMCFIIGQLIAAGVLRACLSRDDQWGYRIPFAIQVRPPPLTSASSNIFTVGLASVSDTFAMLCTGVAMASRSSSPSGRR